MKNLLKFISLHRDVVIRRVTDDAIWLATPASISGRSCSDLSPAIHSLQEARDYLGY